MALPTTISTDAEHFSILGSTGGEVVTSMMGPFISIAGHVYCFLRDNTTETEVRALQGTDPEVSFAEADGANAPTAAGVIVCMAAVQVGDKIHICVTVDPASGSDTQYMRFDMSTASWDTITGSVEITTVDSGFTNVPAKLSNGINVESGGKIRVFHHGEAEIVSSLRERVYVTSSDDDGATWGTPLLVSASGTTEDFFVGCILLGDSDRMHCNYTDSTGRDSQHRSISSADVLDTNAQPDTSLATGRVLVGYGFTGKVGGSTLMRIPYADGGADLRLSEHASGANPSQNTRVGAGSGMNLRHGGFQTFVVYDTDDDMWYCIYIRNDNVRTLVSSGTTWGSETVQFIGLFEGISANIYQRGTEMVIGVILTLDTGNPTYDEVVLRTGLPPIVEPPSAGAIQTHLAVGHGVFI